MKKTAFLGALLGALLVFPAAQAQARSSISFGFHSGHGNHYNHTKRHHFGYNRHYRHNNRYGYNRHYRHNNRYGHNYWRQSSRYNGHKYRNKHRRSHHYTTVRPHYSRYR